MLGATANLRYARRNPDAADRATRLLARWPFKVAAVALANKMARTARALLVKGGVYKSPAAAAGRGEVQGGDGRETGKPAARETVSVNAPPSAPR